MKEIELVPGTEFPSFCQIPKGCDRSKNRFVLPKDKYPCFRPCTCYECRKRYVDKNTIKTEHRPTI